MAHHCGFCGISTTAESSIVHCCIFSCGNTSHFTLLSSLSCNRSDGVLLLSESMAHHLSTFSPLAFASSLWVISSSCFSLFSSLSYAFLRISP